MINEAFWFFYLVAIANSLENLFGIVGIVGIVVALFAVGIGHAPPKESWVDSLTQKLRWILPVFAVCVLVSVLMPPKEAFYAGAGQYVVEASETDQTLLNLKGLLDKKIEELSESE